MKDRNKFFYEEAISQRRESIEEAKSSIKMFRDFTYDYLIKIFNAIQDKFTIRLLGDGLAKDSDRPQLFLRHDIDVSLDHALTLAEIEAEHGIRATYMFIPNSRLYNIKTSQNILRKIISLDHEVALHFDLDDQGREQQAGINDVLENIDHDCQTISDIIGKPVSSISYHRPMQQFIGGEMTVCGRTNAYAADLMELYISDSKGQWRCGDPISLLRSTSAPVVQLLIHPIWYGPQHLDPEQRLEEFYLTKTAVLTGTERERFDADLAFTIPGVRRSNYKDA